MHKKLLLLPIAFLLCTTYAIAQTGIAINNTGAKPDSSAILDVSSTVKGLLTPRMRAAQKDSIVHPAIGLLIFQTDSTPGFRYYTGTRWLFLSSSSSGWQVTGNTGTDGSNFIGTLDNQSLAFRTNNTERMRLDSTGNLGIGLTKPTHSLEVNGAFDMYKEGFHVLFSDNVIKQSSYSGIKYVGPIYFFPDTQRYMINGIIHTPALLGNNMQTVTGYFEPLTGNQNIISADSNYISISSDTGNSHSNVNLGKGQMQMGAQNNFKQRNSNINVYDSVIQSNVSDNIHNLSLYQNLQYNQYNMGISDSGGVLNMYQFGTDTSYNIGTNDNKLIRNVNMNMGRLFMGMNVNNNATLANRNSSIYMQDTSATLNVSDNNHNYHSGISLNRLNLNYSINDNNSPGRNAAYNMTDTSHTLNINDNVKQTSSYINITPLSYNLNLNNNPSPFKRNNNFNLSDTTVDINMNDNAQSVYSSWHLDRKGFNTYLNDFPHGRNARLSMDSSISMYQNSGSKNFSFTMQYPSISLNIDTAFARTGNISITPDIMQVSINNNYTGRNTNMVISDSNVYFTGSSFKMGVGTNNPAYALDVSGFIRSNGLTGGGQIIADANGQIILGASAPTSWSLTGNSGTSPTSNFLGTTDNQDLAFVTNNVERMRMSNTGNLGIGTTTPQSMFEANGSFDLYRNNIHINSSDNIMPFYTSGIQFGGVSVTGSQSRYLAGLINIPSQGLSAAMGYFSNAAGGRQVTMVADSMHIAMHRDSANENVHLKLFSRAIKFDINNNLGINSSNVSQTDSAITSVINDSMAHKYASTIIKPAYIQYGVHRTLTSPNSVLQLTDTNVTVMGDTVRFGLNNANPRYTLDINGTVHINPSTLISGTAADSLLTVGSTGIVNIRAINNTAWALNGNSGTSPSSNFIGTTDNQDLAFITNNTEVMRLGSSGNMGVNTSSPNSYFQVNGSFATKVTQVTTTVDTLSINESIVSVDATTGNTDIYLPKASKVSGRQYTIKKVDSSPNYIKIGDVGAAKIDGNATVIIATQWKFITIVSDGTQWLIISQN